MHMKSVFLKSLPVSIHRRPLPYAVDGQSRGYGANDDGSTTIMQNAGKHSGSRPIPTRRALFFNSTPLHLSASIDIYTAMASNEQPPLSFWERADLYPGQLSAMGAALYSAFTGVFRGSSGSREYKLHVANAAIRKLVTRLSSRQLQCEPPTNQSITKQSLTQTQSPLPVHRASIRALHEEQGPAPGDRDARARRKGALDREPQRQKGHRILPRWVPSLNHVPRASANPPG